MSPSELVRSVSSYARTQFWQLTLLAAAVLVVVRIVRQPHLAHLLCLLVLPKCLVPPLWSSPPGLFSHVQTSAVTPSPAERVISSIGETIAPPIRGETPEMSPTDVLVRPADRQLPSSPYVLRLASCSALDSPAVLWPAPASRSSNCSS